MCIVGHESGRQIVDILKRNPKKESDKYTDEDLQHMRKVVSYCKVGMNDRIALVRDSFSRL